MRARGVRGDAAVGFPEAADRGRRAHRWLEASEGGRRRRRRRARARSGAAAAGPDRASPRTCRSARGAARARPPPGAAAEAAKAAGCGRGRQDERRGEPGGLHPARPRGPGRAGPTRRRDPQHLSPRPPALARPGRPAPTHCGAASSCPARVGSAGLGRVGTLRAWAGVGAEVRGSVSQVRGRGLGSRSG